RFPYKSAKIELGYKKIAKVKVKAAITHVASSSLPPNSSIIVGNGMNMEEKSKTTMNEPKVRIISITHCFVSKVAPRFCSLFIINPFSTDLLNKTFHKRIIFIYEYNSYFKNIIFPCQCLSCKTLQGNETFAY